MKQHWRYTGTGTRGGKRCYFFEYQHLTLMIPKDEYWKRHWFIIREGQVFLAPQGNSVATMVTDPPMRFPL